MRRSLAFAFASIVLAACASTEEDVEAAGNMAQDVGAAAVGAVAAPIAATSASAYTTNAAISDLYEIQSSQLAMERSQSDAVKAFAQHMIQDHTKTSTALKSIAQAQGMAVPASLDARRQTMMENLRAASAEDFDDRYIDQQTAAHQEAVTLHSTYAENGDNQALRAFAAETAPAVQQHLAHVRQLDSSNADD